MFCVGVTFGMLAILGGAWALLYLGAKEAGVNRVGVAHLLNGLARALALGESAPEEKPKPIEVQQIKEEPIIAPFIPKGLIGRVIDMLSVKEENPKAQEASDVRARPNLLTEPDGANGGRGGTTRLPGGPKRRRRQ